MNNSRRLKPRQAPADPFTPSKELSMRDAAEVIYGGAELGDKGIIREVTLDEVTIDPGIQVRVDGLDEARVEQYVEFLLAGGQFKDPIVVYRDGDDLLLAAGFHRCEAYSRAEEIVAGMDDNEQIELAPLMAEIRDGGREAAIEFAEEDNLAHGLELSTKDKRRILERRYERGHEWIKLSNRALAAQLGVSRQTIANWRVELEQETGGKNLPPVQRVGADGKTYDVSGIQAASQLRAARQAVEALNLPPLREEKRTEIRKWLGADASHLQETICAPGGFLRADLPYVLLLETEQEKPRMSLIRWLHTELDDWFIYEHKNPQGSRNGNRQVAEAHDPDALKVVMTRIIKALRTLPRPVSAHRLRAEVDADEELYYAAIRVLRRTEQIKAEQNHETRQITYWLPELEEAAAATAAEDILAIMREMRDPVSPALLRRRATSAGMSMDTYNQALSELRTNGAIVADQDPATGLVTYRLAEDGMLPAAAPAWTRETVDPPIQAPPPQMAMAARTAADPPETVEFNLAVGIALQLERGAMDATDALQRVRQVRSITTLYRLGADRLQLIDEQLARLEARLADLPAHVHQLRAWLQEMAETGHSYLEDDGDAR